MSRAYRSRRRDLRKTTMQKTLQQTDPITGLVAADHSTGAAHGAVLLLEYGDYECPSCCEAEPVTRYLMEAFFNRMRFVFRHFPLVEVHPHAELAAEATEAAAAQDKFWEMHHQLFTHSQRLKPDSTHALRRGDRARHATIRRGDGGPNLSAARAGASACRRAARLALIAELLPEWQGGRCVVRPGAS